MTSGNDRDYEENLSRLKRQGVTGCNFIKAVWEGFSAEVTFELRMKDKRSRPLGCLGVGWRGGQHGAEQVQRQVWRLDRACCLNRETGVDSILSSCWLINYGRGKEQIAWAPPVAQSKDFELRSAGA